MTFKFRLEPLLKHTCYREEIKTQLVIKTRNERDKEVDQLEILKGNLRRTEEENNTKIDCTFTMLRYLHIERLTKEIDVQHYKVNKVEEKLKKCQNDATKVMQERKILEKLKEKHAEEYSKNLMFIEQKMLDELALRAFHIKND